MLKNKRLAGIIALSIVLSSNIFPVHAAEINNSNLNVKCEADISVNKDDDIIVDSPLKEFDSLDKVGKYLNFDYKVPDYTVNNDKVSLIRVEKYMDGNANLRIEYINKITHDYESDTYLPYEANMDKNSWYSLFEFNDDPEVCLKDIKYGAGCDFLNIQTSREEKSLGELNGMYITLAVDLPDYSDGNPDNKSTSKEYSRFYVFEKDNVYYAVEASDFYDEDNLSYEINKIASSLKKPAELTNVSYKVERDNDDFTFCDVYDKEDLREAQDIVGFTPKFITNISDDVKITDCHTFTCNKKDEDINTFQCNYSYKNNGLVVFIQEKDKDNYGYNDSVNGANLDKTDFEKLNWDNVDVYKYFDDGDDKYIYQWKIGNIYYFFETYFNGEKENVDDIVKILFEAK